VVTAHQIASPKSRMLASGLDPLGIEYSQGGAEGQ
jgi:hypothetical protein